MVIVIDGYNVSKRRWRDDGSTLLSRVISYASLKGHQMVLVFDGGPSRYQTTEKRNGVTVVYAGTQSTADEVIKKMIPFKKDTELLVVTSDTNICRTAAAHEVPTLDADVFLSLLERSNREKKQQVPHDGKRRESRAYQDGHMKQDEDRYTYSLTDKDRSDEMVYGQSELDRIMEELSMHAPLKDEEPVASRTRTKKMVSKQEKKLMQILKKL